MSATATFQIAKKYTLRPAGKVLADYELAEEWTRADEDHRGRVDPHFWLEQSIGCDSYLLADERGPVFFFKMLLKGEDAVEIHIQFPPKPEDRKQFKLYRYRIVDGLTRGTVWLEKILSRARIRQMYFDSASRTLIAFAVRRLGFAWEDGKLRKRLAEVQ